MQTATTIGNPPDPAAETSPALAPMITARNVSKVYRTLNHADVQALTGTSFDIQDGELVSLVGPSGCGKSTLLRMLAGLNRPTTGELTLAGKPMRGPSADVAVVFQSPILLPWRTIAENVLLPIEFRRTLSDKDRTHAQELLAMVGLQDFVNRYPSELSGGMQQRAAIVRALVQDPKILLMDEPFGALDAMTREQMNLEVLRIWQHSKKTIVFVTHSITESIFLSDRVFVMTARPGTIAETITIDLPRPRTLDIINTPEFGAYASRIRHLLQASGDLS